MFFIVHLAHHHSDLYYFVPSRQTSNALVHHLNDFREDSLVSVTSPLSAQRSSSLCCFCFLSLFYSCSFLRAESNQFISFFEPRLTHFSHLVNHLTNHCFQLIQRNERCCPRFTSRYHRHAPAQVLSCNGVRKEGKVLHRGNSSFYPDPLTH